MTQLKNEIRAIGAAVSDKKAFIKADAAFGYTEDNEPALRLGDSIITGRGCQAWEKGTGENSVQTTGTGCVAYGTYSVAEGWTSKTLKKGTDPVSGQAAHAEGAETNASGFASHTEGGRTAAEGSHSHAEGYETTALGNDSHTEGNHTITNNFGEHAEGCFNVSHMNSPNYGDPLNTQHTVGIGTAEIDPETGRFIGAKNAIEIMQNGDVYILGIGGFDGTNIESASTLQEVIASLLPST